MPEFKYTRYFEREVLNKRQYLNKEMCEFVVENAVRTEIHYHGRIRYWAKVPELNYRYLRVITLSDRSTIHNAFIDRGFGK